MFSSPNRVLAVILGVTYIVLGLLGFANTTGVPFFATSNGTLLLGLLQVNGLHNVAHLALGALLLAGGLASVGAAKRMNSAVGAVLLVLGLIGLFVIGSEANILALNAAGNVLHFGSAIVLLAAGLGADKNGADKPIPGNGDHP